MSKVVVELLGVNDTRFKDFVDRLEHISLRPGIDVRLGVEIVTRTRAKVRALELDAADTTAKELFFALKHKLSADDAQLVSELGLKKGAIEKNTDKIAHKAQSLSGREKSLSLTPAGTKRILKAVPPKRTMKLLKYRSLDSVLKRQDPRVLYALAALVENDSWHSQVHAKIRRLNSKDIQWQSVGCLSVPKKWHERLSDVLFYKGAIIVNEEAGVVCVLPVADTDRPGSTVLLLGLALQAGVHIATQSLPYKKQALSQGYANILPKIAVQDHPTLSSIHGLTPTWRAVHELIGSGHISVVGQETEFESFDLFWESTETKLASLVEDMDFWVGSHFLGAKASSGPVSLHVLDVAASLVQDTAYGEQSCMHMRSSLWNELQIRYLREDVISRSLINQLSSTSGAMLL